MKKARILSSNSHIDYVARVIDDGETDDAAGAHAHDFAKFVSFPIADGAAVGVIYDSKLINPQFTAFGPRLSRRSGLSELAPDQVNEQTAVVGIILLGTVTAAGEVSHGIPPAMLSPGLDAKPMSPEEIAAFHTGADGQMQLHYFAQVKANAGLLAVPLLEAIIDTLLPACSDADAKRLKLLRQTLVWERTIGSMHA
jgi:hypothetical protein